MIYFITFFLYKFQGMREETKNLKHLRKQAVKSIRLNFLPVGHTHEDIDAFFGVYSKHLAQMDVYTIEDLLQAMESCLAIIKAFPFLLDVVYNIKEWLLPHAEELHAHTKPKSFKFVRYEEGHCIMYYRNYLHMKWEGPQ
ncbi:uncharacterized protein [Acropora muricata]|uniref:uncharacterized protein isoform X1 n=2 Tax=Acropora muricata TaxID=159855 RepID=UPI0034E4CBD8